MIKKLVTGAIPRRSILKGAAAFGAVGAFPAIITRSAFAAGNITVVNSIRSLSNPYHATWNKGGAAFAKTVGADYVTLVTEGNSEKGIADIKAILAKTGGNCVINVDPNDSPDARPIVQACKEAGAYVVTQWNKPNDLHPWDFNPNYVAHISFSGVPYGKAMAEALIKAMGGKGGIVALGGIESNVPAIERKAGLMDALKANPGVQLLDMQVANWSATEALQKTNAWLTQFGDKIGGIWAVTTIWHWLPSKLYEAMAKPASCQSQESTEFSSQSKRSLRVRWLAPSPGIPSGRAGWVFRSGTMPRPAISTRRKSLKTTENSTGRASSLLRTTPRLSTTATSRPNLSSSGMTSGAALADRSSTTRRNSLTAGASRRARRADSAVL